MKVFAIVEGSTEEKVLEKLKGFIGFTIEISRSDGKGQMNQTIRGMINPLIDRLESVRVLILRDLDLNDNETVDSLVQSTEGILQRIFARRNPAIKPKLEPKGDLDNVYIWHPRELDFRVALHVATYRWNDSFIKAMIDDYVLALALEPDIATAIAQSQNLSVNGEALIKKVTEELPALLQRNGIPLIEAKDYVRLYAAIVKAHTSPPVFAEKVLNRSDVNEQMLRNRFRSLFAALEFLR